MIKIMFVCYGNICRSPMAELLMKDYVARKGKASEFFIQSSATSNENLNRGVYYETARVLDRLNIDYSQKRCAQLSRSDYEKYDYIIGMDSANKSNMLRLFGGDPQKKIFLLLDFTKNPRDLEDPWYTRDFEKTYREISEGIEGLYGYLTKNSGNK